MKLSTSNQDTPYAIAVKEHPPIANGTYVDYEIEVLPYVCIIGGQTVRWTHKQKEYHGKIIDHSAIFTDRIFSHWVYCVVPYGMDKPSGIMMTYEVSEKDLLA